MALCSFLLFTYGNIYAQDSGFHDHFDIYSTKNGLSQNDVRSIFQDSYGFIWIGTNGGLNRFDGYSFKIYQKEVNNNKAISSNLISAITEDAYGNLWIGTDDEGVVIMERATDSFISIKNKNTSSKLLTGNHVLSILIDKSNFIWVTTTTGVNKIKYDYTTKTPTIEHLVASQDNPYSISHNYVACAFEDKLGNVWFGTLNGLNRYINTDGGDNHQFIHYGSPAIGRVRSIVSNDSALVIAAANELLTLSYKEINKNNPRFSTVRNNTYDKIISDANQTIWGTNVNGVSVIYYDNGTMFTHQFTHNWADPHSLSKNIVSAIIEDNSGILWIGTNGGGINLYNPNRKNFSHHHKNKHPNSLSYNKIRAIMEDQRKNLWIGTEGGGLDLLPFNKSQNYDDGFIHFDMNEQAGGENYAYSIEEVSFKGSTRIFVGTGYRSHLEVVGHYRPEEHYKNQFLMNWTPRALSLLYYLIRIVSFWVGTYSNGLFRVYFDEYGNYITSSRFVHNNYNESGISSKRNKEYNGRQKWEFMDRYG